ncbi:SH3 domain-containing protein, partial [Alcanivorax sp. HI0083]
MRLVVILLSLMAVLPAWAEPEAEPDAKSDIAPLRVKVAEPFVEIHSGPGRGYPVFHVVERDAPLTLEYRRAGWIKVSTVRGRVGWVPRDALLATLDGSEQTPEMKNLGQEAFQGGHWQASVLM